jgi:hypothetical protein
MHSKGTPVYPKGSPMYARGSPKFNFMQVNSKKIMKKASPKFGKRSSPIGNNLLSPLSM